MVRKKEKIVSHSDMNTVSADVLTHEDEFSLSLSVKSTFMIKPYLETTIYFLAKHHTSLGICRESSISKINSEVSRTVPDW